MSSTMILVRRAAHAFAALCSIVLASAASAQLNNEVPPELRDADIVEHLDQHIPLDATFFDEDGKPVRLGDFFHGDKPIILQLGYLRCPMLCNLVLNGAIDGLKGVEWDAGKDFEIVSISVNPTEPPQLAKAKRDGYAVEYGRSGAERGMHFLTGPEASSRAVADSVGFRFVKQGNDYAHAAAIFLITPDGRVSRYLYGARFESKDLRLAILEASEGKIGTTLDRFILWCHIYDPTSRGYVLFAVRLVRLGAVVTLVVLAVGLTILWRQDLRKTRKEAALDAAAPSLPEPRR